MNIILREELKGWKVWEVLWFLCSCAIILGLSLHWKDSPLGIVSAVSGVVCVVCTGKGKLSAYLFGAINTLLYAYISFGAKYYGEVLLNVLYYFPLQFYGFFVWKNHMNRETHEVSKRSMTARSRLLMFASVLLGTVVLGKILQFLGGRLSYVDALSTVVSVVAMVVSIQMYAEQWLLWIFVDIVTIFMWYMSFVNGRENMATLLMWVVYLFNALIMYFKWKKEVEADEIQCRYARRKL